MYRLFREVARRRSAGEPAALLSVVRAGNEATSLLGPQMMVAIDGTILGAIGRRKDQRELRRVALQVLQTGQPQQVRLNPTSGKARSRSTGQAVPVDVYVEAV